VGAHGIDAARTEDFGDLWREILIEVDLHPAWTPVGETRLER
jgi:hypothetical protein